MALIALFPQVHFIVNRGHEWHGANVIAHPDEVAYSAYAASLIRGNPRRYDPFTGRGAEAPAAESLFSIQFVPAYAVALPARWLHLSAAQVFMILPPLCAFVSALAIFWFVWLLTGDDRFSATAAVIVLGLGTLFAGQGLARHILNLPFLIPEWISKRVAPTSLYHLPFLRLYQPAVAFPLFFILCALVWIALTRKTNGRAAMVAAIAGLTFALLVFSYFFLWTAAAAFLFSAGALWLIASADRKRTLLVFGIILTFAIAALIPYLAMLGRRTATVDTAQALIFSHQFDLIRLPEFIALLAMLIIAVRSVQGVISWRRPQALFTMAISITVFVVFNQQVVTGRSLQPIHYEWFIANYCALLALLVALALGSRKASSQKRLVVIAAVAVLWTFAEVWLAASVSFDYNRQIDDGKPVADRLAQAGSVASAVVLIDHLKLADRLPTDAPQAVLWAPRMLVFPGVSEAENRERFWRQLYYLGYDEKKFMAEVSDWNFLTGMFPYQRLSPVVTGSQSPITPEELRAQYAAYLEYAHAFNRDRAASPALSYLVVQADRQPDFANLDRWYERGAGERVGDSILYQLKLRE